jgi:phenylalanyl-tRNA synthetase beta chain
MRVPLKWLKEFVEIPVSVEELAERLTVAGIEVAAIESYPPAHLGWQGIYVGEVISVEPHPNADRLVVAQVDWGEGPVPSVTGAPNVRVGDQGLKVPVALPGARLVNAYGEDPPIMEVRTAKIRGVESKAVICSEKELGLSEDHTGVLILDPDASVGMPLQELLGTEVLELDLTPNLGRCLSIVGVAREAAALTDGKLTVREPEWQALGEPVEGQAEVAVEDPELCPRYTAAIIRDVQNAAAPFWLRYRLLLCSMRPINAIVDITNYVMLEWGQPLHAFDYDKLVERAGGNPPKIIIRRARHGEKIITLDGIERELDEEVLLICDEAGPIAIAGVMGGLETEVTEQTRNVLLESASFHAINNRRTSQRLGLPSEAAHRFSRGIPPELCERGAVRAAELMRTLTGGKISKGLLDAYLGKRPPQKISLKAAEVERLLGLELKPSKIGELLGKFGFSCGVSGETLEVTVPYWRLDVEIPADLVEEVARAVGYDQLPSRLMGDPLPPQRRDRSLELEERVRDVLVGLGLTEVINYSLTSPESVARLSPQDEPEYIELSNPISRGRRAMRRTLMDLLLENVATNQRHSDSIAIFELGRVYLPEQLDAEGLPQEPRRLGIALAGLSGARSWAAGERPVDFFDLKGIVEELLSQLGIKRSQVHFKPGATSTFHPGRCAELLVEGERLGPLGEVHPQVAEAFDLKGRVYLAELDLERLLVQAAEERLYRPLPRFPAVRMDLAVVVDEKVPAQQVERLIRENGGALLEDVVLFDLYRGEPVPAGKKSLAYALTYRARDRTLTDEEAQAVHDGIMAALERGLNAQARGTQG